MNYWVLAMFFFVGFVSIIGFFCTKGSGYGRYTTSIFLILLTLILSSILFAARILEGNIMGNVMFSVIGFAGGLFANKVEK